MATVYKEIMGTSNLGVLMERYEQFKQVLEKDEIPPKVFNPLKPSLVQELQLIREISEHLQKKKNEDVNKAAEAEKQPEEKKESETENVAEKQE